MGPVLSTPRLDLREMVPDDLDFLAAMVGDPEVMRHYTRVLDRAAAREWLERQRARYARDGHGLWLAIERATGLPVGQVGVTVQEVEGEPLTEVGYMIHRDHWRRGFASEAALACRDHAFGALDREEVFSLIRPENLPSQGVARKLGMRSEGLVSFYDRDHLLFSVRRAELGG